MKETRTSLRGAGLAGGDAGFAALAAFAALGGYFYTLAPTVTSGDSGELVSAACTLGVPHPPGYPLWTITAHFFTRIVPFKDVAARVNLMSAFLGACTVALVYLSARALGLNHSLHADARRSPSPHNLHKL